MNLRKKIVLINPPSPWLISDRDEVPLGLLYLASFLRRVGADVEFLDLSGGVYDTNWVEDMPFGDYYGIGFTSPQFIYAREILNNIKRMHPQAVVIAGGAHPTCMPQQVLDAGFDVVVRGEGEQAIHDILVRGVTQKVYDQAYMQDINNLPFPAYDLVDMSSYISNQGVVSYMQSGHKEKREVNIITSRGCPFNCAYCTKFKGQFRQRKLESVLAEIEYLMVGYDINRIFIIDDNITTSRYNIDSLCIGMSRLNYMYGLKWHCLGRADSIDFQKASLMARSGCMGIDFGIESGSQAILDLINKKTSVKAQEGGLQASYEAGLKVRAQFMVGLPGETEETHAQDLDFIRRNSKYVERWGIHTFIPYPSCDIWELPEKYGYLVDKSTDFQTYQTIGKPGEWNFKPINNEVVEKRRLELLDAAGEKNIFVGVKQ